ncbi:MAG: hypothetical protein GY805_14125, partial [Chloroflexi bacterium]|nr:hypothetical protein [Chloroflexota bacterium]
MEQIRELIKSKQLIKGSAVPRMKYEFQAYGQRLARDMGELAKESLYMKLAKEVDRSLLEQAREHVLGSDNVRNRGALFMYKLKQLKNERRRL